MKLPEYVVIKGEVWAIERRDLSEVITYSESGQPTGHAVGLCDAYNKTIFIHTKIRKKDIRSTFLHELNHAILCEMGFNQTSFSSDFEELIVENFANTYDRVFKSLVFDKPILIETD